jgi:hypothetical protein
MKKRWSYANSINLAENYLGSVGLPTFAISLDKPDADLKFSDVIHATVTKLEEYLVIYGGYKSLLEQHVADIEARKGAMEAQFDEAYSIAMYQIAEEYVGKGERKPTKEQLRGEIMLTKTSLVTLRQDIIDATAVYIRLLGQLKLYTSAFATVSRIVSLRTQAYKDSE